jgi:hypothetical protein
VVLGRKLAYPHNDAELKQAKLDALFSVELFKKVVLHYKGGIIPEPPFVNNTLTRDFGLSTDFHDEFLRILRKNLEFVGGGSELAPTAHATSEVVSRGKSVNATVEARYVPSIRP